MIASPLEISQCGILKGDGWSAYIPRELPVTIAVPVFAMLLSVLVC